MKIFSTLIFIGAMLLAIICATNLVPTDTDSSILDRIAVTALWLASALHWLKDLIS